MIPTTKGLMSPASLVDELTYSSYRFNRDRSPHISAERWARIYPNAAALEARYQAEQAWDKAERDYAKETEMDEQDIEMLRRYE